VLGANPKEGMKIFTSKVRKTPLNPDKVLEFLRVLLFVCFPLAHSNLSPEHNLTSHIFMGVCERRN
jgi:hypothetical protein